MRSAIWTAPPAITARRFRKSSLRIKPRIRNMRAPRSGSTEVAAISAHAPRHAGRARIRHGSARSIAPFASAGTAARIAGCRSAHRRAQHARSPGRRRAEIRQLQRSRRASRGPSTTATPSARSSPSTTTAFKPSSSSQPSTPSGPPGAAQHAIVVHLILQSCSRSFFFILICMLLADALVRQLDGASPRSIAASRRPCAAFCSSVCR